MENDTKIYGQLKRLVLAKGKRAKLLKLYLKSDRVNPAY